MPRLLVGFRSCDHAVLQFAGILKKTGEMNDWISHYLDEHRSLLKSIPSGEVAGLIELFRQAWTEERQIFVFGNGGSAANASHFATDLGKGSSDIMPQPFRVVSLNDNVPWITAIGNDYSNEEVFSRQLRNYGRHGDLAMTMSVSGNSPNLVKAIEWANAAGLHTIALVGGNRGKLADLARSVLVVDSVHYGRVEDAHMTICHMICYAFMEGRGSF